MVILGLDSTSALAGAGQLQVRDARAVTCNSPGFYIDMESIVRKLKFVVPNLERRIQKWFNGLKIMCEFHVEELPKDRNVLKLITHLPKTLACNEEFVGLFENEVLRPAGYQIIEYYVGARDRKFGADFILTSLKARTEYISKPEFLYHMTLPSSVPSILKRGLLPKDGPSMSSMKRYKSRVYLMTYSTKYLAFVFEDVLLNSDQYSDRCINIVKNTALIRIDTSKFSRFNIFRDPETIEKKKVGDIECVWTPTHIPAKALEVVYSPVK